ncbi:SAM-dependent methyltransferase [Nocardia sp. NPDC052566]|uniref:SAM-dependent methyltransferase n=1 Tax=Nocardia sp. NPDC052566 TaxID=3364330 RepID=UPI0037C76487
MPKTTVDYWEAHYQQREQIWSGQPNPLLVREIAGLPPGSALDLGCGEGADALWLAAQGWRVTAVDVSATALGRAAERAARDGLADAVDWQRHDLAESFPDGRFDLVTAQFFHSPVAIGDERDKVLRRAADAVAPGGRLLIGGHAEWPSWVIDPPAHVYFPTTAEVLAALALGAADWRVETDDVAVREVVSPEGEPATRKDNVLRIHRIR